MKLLHVYGQEVSGQRVWIRGNRAALESLLSGLQAALLPGTTQCTLDGFVAGDGVEFEVTVRVDNIPKFAGGWEQSELPYSVEKDQRQGVIGPWVEEGLDGAEKRPKGRRGRDSGGGPSRGGRPPR